MAPSTTAADKHVTGTQAIDRASDLLLRVMSAPEPITLTELVAATGLAKGTTSRILSALERAGLLARSSRGGYEPGSALNNFAVRGGAYAALISSVMPAMQRIADQTGETVTLAVPAQLGVHSIAQADGRYLLGARNWVGEYVPVHCSAAGKVLLAYGLADLPAVLPALTPETVTDRAPLEAQLRSVREQGYAAIRNELELGLVAVAVPVTIDQRAVAALSVTGPAERITVADERRLAQLMSDALRTHNRHEVANHEGAA